MGRIWVIVAALACGVFGQASAAPLEAYGRLPSLGQLAMSPDGANIAFINTAADGQRSIAVVRVADQKPLIVAQIGKAKVRQLDWAGSQDLLITTSATTGSDNLATNPKANKDEYYYVQTLNITSGRLTRRLENVINIWNTIAGWASVRMVDGKPCLFVPVSQATDLGGVLSLARIDVATDNTRIVARGTPDTTGWLADAGGQPIAETRYDWHKNVWSLYLRMGDRWVLNKEITALIDLPTLLGYDRSGTALEVDTGDGTIQSVSLSDGAWKAAPADTLVERVSDPVSLRLIGGRRYPDEGGDLSFFDPSLQGRWQAVQRAFAGEKVWLVGTSDDLQKIIVHVFGAADGSSYSLIDLTTHKAIWIGDEYTDVTPADVAEVRAINYPAADGLNIPAILTLPKGKPAQGLPLIVFPHGGPQSWDSVEFDWWAQAMASRGYAVLQPNFRGSTGYGNPFQSAGFGQFGRKMQTDLSDGVRYLAAKGTIDPKRVCIVGASYGGYAALAGATIDTGVYRCAVVVAGLSDLHKFLDPLTDHSLFAKADPDLRYWDRYIGASGPKDQVIDDMSPAKQAAKANIPILLIHGKDDTVVPFEQSQTMSDALKKAGKPTNLVILAHEDHWLSRSETREQMLKATMAFVEANNPPT